MSSEGDESEVGRSSAEVKGLGRRNPVEVLHETHTGRLCVRDRFGYMLRVDADEVAR